MGYLLALLSLYFPVVVDGRFRSERQTKQINKKHIASYSVNLYKPAHSL